MGQGQDYDIIYKPGAIAAGNLYFFGGSPVFVIPAEAGIQIAMINRIRNGTVVHLDEETPENQLRECLI